MNFNKEWHLKHPMPKKLSEVQRIEWHKEYVLHCKCRPIPKGLPVKEEKFDRK